MHICLSTPSFLRNALVLLGLLSAVPCLAGIGFADSPNVQLDNQPPNIVLAELPSPGLYHTGDEISLAWTVIDDNPGTDPSGFTAAILYPDGEHGTFSYHPYVGAYDWEWMIPEHVTGHCYLQVTAIDAFGLSQTVVSEKFVVHNASINVPDGRLQLGFSPPSPNPFNPSTTLSFELATESAVQLVVYDARGRKIRTLANGHKPAGHFSTSWNGQNDNGRRVPGGLYLFVLDTRDTTGDHRLVRKAVLLP